MAPGSGDNQMSALGAGAVKEGDWVVSLGTSGMLCHHEPVHLQLEAFYQSQCCQMHVACLIDLLRSF